jgi:glucokinase
MLQDALGIPVFIGNDADLAGLAEHQRGAGVGSETMIYMTVSTGVGSGLILHGEPFSGRGQGGEAGHIVVEPDGPLCSCGKQGHLEAVAAGSGMTRIVRNRIAAGETTSILTLAGENPADITAEMITEAAQKGDAMGLETITQAGRYLGIAIASLMVLFNPDLFVLGGGVTEAGDLLLKPMHDAIEKYAMHKLYWEHTPIVLAKLDKDVGLIGAAALVKIRQTQG